MTFLVHQAKCASSNIPASNTPFTWIRTKFFERSNFTRATRLHGTVQTVLHYCFHESVQIFASVSIGMALFFIKGA